MTDTSLDRDLTQALYAETIDAPRILALMSSGADSARVHHLQATPLHICAYRNHAALGQDMLARKDELGIDINAVDAFGLSPLMWAAWLGHTDLVKALLQHGARHDIADVHLDNALHKAARMGQADAVALLIDAGADINARNHYTRSALEYAIRNNHDDVAALLRAAGAKEGRFFRPPPSSPPSPPAP